MKNLFNDTNDAFYIPYLSISLQNFEMMETAYQIFHPCFDLRKNFSINYWGIWQWEVCKAIIYTCLILNIMTAWFLKWTIPVQNAFFSEFHHSGLIANSSSLSRNHHNFPFLLFLSVESSLNLTDEFSRYFCNKRPQIDLLHQITPLNGSLFCFGAQFSPVSPWFLGLFWVSQCPQHVLTPSLSPRGPFGLIT